MPSQVDTDMMPEQFAAKERETFIRNLKVGVVGGVFLGRKQEQLPPNRSESHRALN